MKNSSITKLNTICEAITHPAVLIFISLQKQWKGKKNNLKLGQKRKSWRQQKVEEKSPSQTKQKRILLRKILPGDMVVKRSYCRCYMYIYVFMYSFARKQKFPLGPRRNVPSRDIGEKDAYSSLFSCFFFLRSFHFKVISSPGQGRVA